MDARVRKLTKRGLAAADAVLLVNSGLDTPRKIKAAATKEISDALKKTENAAKAVQSLVRRDGK